MNEEIILKFETCVSHHAADNINFLSLWRSDEYRARRERERRAEISVIDNKKLRKFDTQTLLRRDRDRKCEWNWKEKKIMWTPTSSDEGEERGEKKKVFKFTFWHLSRPISIRNDEEKKRLKWNRRKSSARLVKAKKCRNSLRFFPSFFASALATSAPKIFLLSRFFFSVKNSFLWLWT